MIVADDDYANGWAWLASARDVLQCRFDQLHPSLGISQFRADECFLDDHANWPESRMITDEAHGMQRAADTCGQGKTVLVGVLAEEFGSMQLRLGRESELLS